MKRREFVVLAGGAVIWPLAALSQTKGPIRIGFLYFGSPANPYDQSLVDAFRLGMKEVGLVENRDVVLDIIWITGSPEDAVAETLKRGVDLLVTSGSTASVAANRLAGTTPIVFISVGNPLGMGLVESLARPGRNVTGFSDILADIAGKLVEIACEVVSPNAAVIDYFWHTAWPDGYNRFAATEAAAVKARVTLRSRGIASIPEIDSGVADMKKDGATVVIVQPSPFTYTQRQLLLDAAARHGIGMIFAFPVAAREGALIGYGPDYVQMYRKAPVYIDRILKGANPADLPVEQPTKIQTVINMKTAKALGIDVPLSLMLRADELLD